VPSHSPFRPLHPRQYADLARTAQVKASQALVYAHKHLNAELSAADRLADLEDRIEEADARLKSILSDTVEAKHAETVQARYEITALNLQLRTLEAKREEIDALTAATITATQRAEQRLARARRDEQVILDAYEESVARIKTHWRKFTGRRAKLQAVRVPTRDLLQPHDEERIIRVVGGDASAYADNRGRATRRAS
jgi:chromosome segregation ATPase